MYIRITLQKLNLSIRRWCPKLNQLHSIIMEYVYVIRSCNAGTSALSDMYVCTILKAKQHPRVSADDIDNAQVHGCLTAMC